MYERIRALLARAKPQTFLERLHVQLDTVRGRGVRVQVDLVRTYCCAEILGVVEAALAADRVASVETYPGLSFWMVRDSAAWMDEHSGMLEWQPNAKTMHEQWLGHWYCPKHYRAIIAVDT